MMMKMKPENIEDIYELSPLQQGMLFHTLYAPESALYFEQFGVTLHGNLNIPAFERAWQQVMDRNAVLRTSFHWDDLEKPLQVVHRRVKLSLEQQDWRQFSLAEQQERLEAYLKADRDRGFKFSEAPLMRLALIRLTGDTYQFIWSFHHILLDGWSTYLITQEISTFYEAYCREQKVHIELGRPYADYIAWLQQQDLSAAEVFWRRVLKGFTAPIPLDVDWASGRLPDPKEGYAEQQVRLPMTTTTPLQTLARQYQLTLNTLVQGVWALLLSHYSGEEDVVFGMIVSGRPTTLTGVESIVGLFINTLPLRVRVAPQTSLMPWLKELQAQQFEVRQYEYSPLVQVQGWSEVPRGKALFESILVFENHPGAVSLPGRTESRTIGHARIFERTNYPLTVLVGLDPELWIKVIYDCRRFDRATITRMLGHFQTSLEGIVANPEQRLSDLSLLTKAERRQLLGDWNDTRRVYMRDHSIAQFFEAQAARSPRAISFVYDSEELSYQELNWRANQVAHYLQTLGVGPEVLVGVCLERSLDLVIALLGIVKAGGVYLPLDPSYPQERLAFMLEDAHVSVLLTQQRFATSLSAHGARVVYLDADNERIARQNKSNPVSAVTAEHLAYVIYTSGSTGRPKGVTVGHKQLLNRLYWMWEAYPFEEHEVCCQKTALNFVDSIWELFGPLLQGIPTVIIGDEVLKDPHALVQTLSDHCVTRIWIVPLLLRVMLDTYHDLQRRLPVLKFWVTSGEAISVDLFHRFQKLMPQSVLYNVYGASEVWDVTWYNPQIQNDALCSVPIGRPISNTQVYILDTHLEPVPIGIPGELHVGGDGLARAYLNSPHLTAEKFLPNPFSNEPGARLYKTGDLARYLPDGNIEFLRRIDHQVKIRGFRIELDEIEAVLGQHPAVREAAVLAREDVPGEHRLVGYVVPDKGAVPTVSGLRNFLKQKLPDYMLPSAFVLLDALPLTPNGKVDRRALPAPDTARPELEGAYVAPHTPVEEVLAGIWADILGLEQVGVHDNFFTELGGHSLLGIQLVSRVRNTLHVKLPLRCLFEAPTVSSLAAAILQDSNVGATIEKTAQLLLTLVQLSDEEVETMLSERTAFPKEDRAKCAVSPNARKDNI